MNSIILFGVIFLLMIMEDKRIDRDIKASAKSPFTKNDAYYFHKYYDK